MSLPAKYNGMNAVLRSFCPLSATALSLHSFQIRDVSLSDAGWYDCQVNTVPKISNKSYLSVYDGPRRRQPEVRLPSAVRPAAAAAAAAAAADHGMVATQPGDRMVAASTEGEVVG